jgi:anti-sigma B factor antagonist
MEITSKAIEEGVLELQVQGRIDGYWSEKLSTAVDQAIGDGVSQLHLDLSKVDFLSSAGIRVFLQGYKGMSANGGTFMITRISAPVRSVLEMAGMQDLFNLPQAEIVPARKLSAEPKRLESEKAIYQIFDKDPESRMHAAWSGAVDKWAQGGFSEADAQSMEFPDSTMGFGLGAFGSGYSDCKDRYGLYVAAGGAAFYQPTDGSRTPDFSVADDSIAPNLSSLAGFSAHGSYACLVRFEAKAEPPGIVALSEVIAQLHEITGSKSLILSYFIETTSVIGSAMMDSALESGVSGASAATGEACERALLFGSGVSLSAPGNALSGELSHHPNIDPIYGRLHAAVFPYMSLDKGDLLLAETVAALTNQNEAQGLLQLGSSPESGVDWPETQCLSGAFWVGIPEGSI